MFLCFLELPASFWSALFPNEDKAGDKLGFCELNESDEGGEQRGRKKKLFGAKLRSPPLFHVCSVMIVVTIWICAVQIAPHKLEASDLQDSWTDPKIVSGLIKAFEPEGISLKKVGPKTAVKDIAKAFEVGERKLGVNRTMSAREMASEPVQSKVGARLIWGSGLFCCARSLCLVCSMGTMLHCWLGCGVCQRFAARRPLTGAA